MPSVAVYVALLIASVLPRVEDPWPDVIGLDVLFAGAGVGGVLAGIVYSESSPKGRDQAIRTWGRFGFIGGVGFYAASLLAQVGFG